MAPTWFKLVLVIAVIVVLFGRGRISDMMGDLAKGIKSFKSGLKDDDETVAAPNAAVGQDASGERLSASAAARETAKVG
jgi:sec-independent protein translocase protein TatA